MLRFGHKLSSSAGIVLQLQQVPSVVVHIRSQRERAAVEERNERARSAQARETTLSERKRVHREKEEKRRQAAERAEQEREAAQKREAEQKPVEVFEINDAEAAPRLREAYSPALVRVTRLRSTYRIEDPEHRGAEINSTVQSERQALRERNMDPDRVFAKRREEHAEALAARQCRPSRRHWIAAVDSTQPAPRARFHAFAESTLKASHSLQTAY
jgi:hypothetical protein